MKSGLLRVVFFSRSGKFSLVYVLLTLFLVNLCWVVIILT